MNKRPVLTIGMPTCYDYTGAFMSVMALKMYHDLDNGDLEIIIVDNTPDAAYRQKLREQIYHKPNPEKKRDYKVSIVSNSNLISFQTSQAAANSGLHLHAARITSPPSRAKSLPSLRA